MDEGGMGSASDGFGAKFIPGFGKQDDKLNQAKLDPKKRLATQDVRDGPLNKAGFQDPSGSIGKGKGVFAFSDKYGGNIDSYAPIYNPQTFGGCRWGRTSRCSRRTCPRTRRHPSPCRWSPRGPGSPPCEGAVADVLRGEALLGVQLGLVEL